MAHNNGSLEGQHEYTDRVKTNVTVGGDYGNIGRPFLIIVGMIILEVGLYLIS